MVQIRTPAAAYPTTKTRLSYAGSNLTAHAKCTDDEITWCATLGLVYVDIRELTYLHSTRWLKRWRKSDMGLRCGFNEER